MKQKKLIIIAVVLFSIVKIFAQPSESLVKIIISPNHSDWIYKLGEKVQLNVQVLKFNYPIENVKIYYEIGLETQKPIVKDSMLLKTGVCTINANSLKEPGFLRCIVKTTVDGIKYESTATVGYNPYDIKPTTELPKDFDEFWKKAIKESSKLSLDPKFELLPERCTNSANVYQVSFQNYMPGMRVYGILVVPKKPGKYPALLKVPGAGVREYTGDLGYANKGIITLQIGIHGIPVNMDPKIYEDLKNTTLYNYPFFNLDDKDHYYYKRVYLGCVRAIDFIYSLPEFDGQTVAVEGGSQGGALSIVTAGLDSRVKYLVSFYPALCDLTGYLHGRAGGWPHMFAEKNKSFNVKDDKIETSKYYDVVNFARRIKVPGYYSWGFNDLSCPPTSTFSAYNVIDATKELHLFPDTGHWRYVAEQGDVSKAWLIDKLLSK